MSPVPEPSPPPSPGAAPGTGVGRLYRVLWENAAHRRGRIVLSFLLLTAAQVVRLSVPWFFGRAVNALQLQGDAGVREAAGNLLSMLGAVALAWLMHGPARVMERFTGLAVRERFADRLHGAVLGRPLGWHEKHHSGETIYRLNKAGSALSTFAQTQFMYVQNAVNILGPVVALFWLSPATGGAALIGYALIALFVVRIDGVMVRLVEEEHRAERRYHSALVDGLGNIATVLMLRLEAPTRALLRTRLLETFVPLRRSIVVNEIKWGGVDLFNNALRIGLVALFAGLDWRRDGVIAVGTAVTVHQYAQQIGSVVAGMAMQWNDLVRHKTEVSGVDDLLAAPAGPTTGVVVPPDWRELRVEGLHFTHPAARGRPTLEAVSLTFSRGERVALVGESGAGKSSLLRVLAGLVEPDRIAIAVDGQPSAARHFGAIALLLPQDPEVFEATILENLTLGLPQTSEAIARASALAGFEPVLRQLPQGLETRVAERGANLSGGQKQRLALARGLLAGKDASLILLDEATSSIDAPTEAAIYDDLMSTLTDVCLVASIHRLHLLPRFDTVVMMADGKVVDRGRPTEVLARWPEFFEHARPEPEPVEVAS